MENKKGLLVIISAPSGGGKDAVTNALVREFPGSYKFITTTTRLPRPGNKEGVDYHFISKENFEDQIKQGEFLEHNFYNGYYYGTPRKALESALEKDPIIFLIVETNGKKNIDKAGIANFSIFFLPENEGVLKERIEKRGGLSPAQIEERLENARREIKESKTYDLNIVNRQGKIEETIAQAAAAIRARLGRAEY
jgi:guanylate kinase